MRIRVVAGAIERGGKILCAQRGVAQRHAGMWELPGGKVEPGESDEDALARELQEELGVAVHVGQQLGVSDHDYPAQSVRLVGYRCTIAQGQPVATEHAQLKWVGPEALDELDWAPADRPLVARLK
jgi:8-oxo-dGTP diphosphatase